MELQARRWSSCPQLDDHGPGAGRQGGGILSCGGAERRQLTAGVGRASACGRHNWLGLWTYPCAGDGPGGAECLD